MKNYYLIAKLTAAVLILLVFCVFALSCSNSSQTTPDSVETENGSDTAAITEKTDADTSATPKTQTDETSEAYSETETDSETTAKTEPENSIIHVESLELDRYSLELTEGESEMPIVTMLPDNASDKSELWSSDDTSVATVNRYGNVTAVSEGTCTVTVRSSDNRELFCNVSVTVKAKPTAASAPENSAAWQESTTSPTYINGILIVNKTYPLPSDYNPGVDSTAWAALCEMFDAASADGISLWVASGFRSYDTQNRLYNNYVAQDGKAAADTYSARPGHSEHQTGLAFDLNYVADYFAYTPAGIWVAENSWKYGFVIRYPAGKEAVTGYKYEPWHVRYFGKDVARALYESGLCLEEYLGITSEYGY